MPNQTFRLHGRAVLLAAIAAAYPVVGYTAPAARVDFATGDVRAIGPNGQARTVLKGAQIEQGETVSTNNGRAQLRFTDGAYVSLQPQSEFRIDQYRFDGKQDGSEKGFFSLIKGGLRTITGLVGRSNKNNYQVTTSVATIGIRGTEYTIQYGQSIVGTVGEGEINVCNGAGCLSVTNGESYYVQSQEIKPVLTNKRTDLPPPEPTQPPSNFVQNVVDPGIILTGVQSPVSIARVSDFCGVSCTSNFGTATFDSDGTLLDLNGETFSDLTMSGNDGIIAWGSGFSSSGGETVHFAVGLPTSASDLASLAISSPVASYSLIGGSSPTFHDFSAGTTVAGTLTGGTFVVNFAAMTVDASIAMSFNLPSGTMALSGAGTGMSISTFSGSAFSGFFCASNACTISGGSCSTTGVSMQGFLAGPNAIRGGLVADISVSGTTSDSTSFNGAAIGSAAFAKDY